MTQIAVKLPDALVRELDRLVADGVFSNRSVAVRHAVESVVAAHRRDVIGRAYAEGYLRLPESDEEIAEATRLAAHAVNDEPWEKWW